MQRNVSTAGDSENNIRKSKHASPRKLIRALQPPQSFIPLLAADVVICSDRYQFDVNALKRDNKQRPNVLKEARERRKRRFTIDCEDAITLPTVQSPSNNSIICNGMPAVIGLKRQ